MYNITDLWKYNRTHTNKTSTRQFHQTATVSSRLNEISVWVSNYIIDFKRKPVPVIDLTDEDNEISTCRRSALRVSVLFMVLQSIRSAMWDHENTILSVHVNGYI